MATAWQLHGNSMATAWQLHGDCMATAWQQHGNRCFALVVTKARQAREVARLEAQIEFLQERVEEEQARGDNCFHYMAKVNRSLDMVKETFEHRPNWKRMSKKAKAKLSLAGVAPIDEDADSDEDHVPLASVGRGEDVEEPLPEEHEEKAESEAGPSPEA